MKINILQVQTNRKKTKPIKAGSMETYHLHLHYNIK